jgi:putative ABC transport system permease protein
MFRNNFKTALRSLLRNKGFAFLNIFGLALGLCIFLLIVFYVVDELSYDRFNAKSDRIFRVNTDIKSGATASSRAITAPIIATALMNNFPEVEKAVRLLPDEELIKKGDELVLENKIAYGDPNIFDVFTLPMIEGNPKTALAGPNSVVITETTAKKYFNTIHALGKTIAIMGDNNSSTVYNITGVIKDIPKQSHFNFDFFLPMVSVQISYNKSFNALYPFSTYVLLKQGAGYKKLESKFPALIKANLSYYDAMEKNGDYLRINLTPLHDIHLHSNRTNELGNNGSMQYVRIFSGIAVFILLIACINFMNLSTARSSNRVREVGVRKVLGSSRTYLVAQFLSESFLVTLFAAMIAIWAAWALLPLFNQLSGKDIAITMQTVEWLLPSAIIVIVAVSVLAGSYPAFFLSSFKPINVLKGKLSIGFKGSKLRSFLVVLQFSVSIFLIIGTLVIYYQLHYIQHKDLGFNRDQVLVVKNMNSLNENQAKVLKQEVKQLTGVINATLSSFLPTGSRRWINYVGTEKDQLETQFWPVDEDYLGTMGMHLTKGRNFSTRFSTDSSGIIINETAAKILGISGNALNKKIYYGNGEKEFDILGIVKDFNFSSMRENIAPVVMIRMTPWARKKEGDGADNLSIKANAANWPALIASIENKWKILMPHQHFEYSFMDEDFDAIYRAEQRMGKLSLVFTTVAIVIACLGLFGLAAYAAEQRTKEISIRKVLGADVSTLAAMLSKDFIKLVVLAFIISAPLSWWLMNKWLQDFAYRINIGWSIFFLAGILAVAIALATVIFQALKAALANPVESLRAE